jgi:hypothetical protein
MNNAETSKQARMPDMGASAMANKSKGRMMKTPAMDMTPSHIPDMAEGVTAAPRGAAANGMSGWPSASMSEKGRMPDIAPSVMSKKGRGC